MNENNYSLENKAEGQTISEREREQRLYEIRQKIEPLRVQLNILATMRANRTDSII